MAIELRELHPSEFEAWTTVFALAEDFPDGWVLVGGQMVQLHAVELGARSGVRPTNDVDVIVDVRTRRGATGQLAQGPRMASVPGRSS
jgi:hypothetical protein